MGNIFDIAKKLNINEKYIIPFGYDKAKISLKINDELKNDLLAINGISYSWSRADRRNKRNPYDTITMVFYIDTKLIDTEVMAKKLGGYSFYDTDYRKTAGSCGGYKDGTHYSGVPYGSFKTRRMELHADEKLNNEKKDNKALYE